MVDRGYAASSWFELSLRPWLRQGQAIGASMPFLVPLKLIGVTGHTWTKRTAEVVLRGLGFVESVAERTASRFDMSTFQVWLETADPSNILAAATCSSKSREANTWGRPPTCQRRSGTPLRSRCSTSQGWAVGQWQPVTAWFFCPLLFA
ncbi:hypothetical protein VPH35_116803 [Triticum aestivum]|uniref:DUF4283 domain-containing protein n=1 Tax=Aegilops tauschii subsp. strangulata TaxID=200361 RepID=A0A453NTP0_AEGTS